MHGRVTLMDIVRRRHLLKLFDISVVLFSFAMATVAALYEKRVPFADFLMMRVRVQNFVIFAGFVAIWHITFVLIGLYRPRRLSSLWGETADVVKATSLGSLWLLIMAVVAHITMMTPIVLVSFWVVSTATMFCSRLTLRYVLGRIRARGHNLRRVLNVGTNARAIEFARKIEAQPELGYSIIGFVDEDWPGAAAFRATGYQLCCDFVGLPNFLRENVVDEVVMSLPLRSYYGQASTVAALCEEHGITMRFLSTLFDLKTARSRAEEFEGDWLLTHYTGTPQGWSTLAKRAFDFTISLILIVPLAPLFLIVALLIKLTSPGPVFFIQDRMGLNKRKFPIVKFRTMVADAENRRAELQELNEVSGPVFKIANDPRITSIGKLLRKTSIDELPQLFNILKGDMSLVGPRPLPVRDYEGFDQDWQRRRFSVRPGITCLWQIKGRSLIHFDKWMELDMQYIDEWSLWLDLKILVKTIPAVLKGLGAA